LKTFGLADQADVLKETAQTADSDFLVGEEVDERSSSLGQRNLSMYLSSIW
jgi:hypothetical protein